MTDVEHSNEDTTDTILPMMHLRPDDPVWKERARRLAELTRDRWTGRNQRGFLQFKSIYFSADKVDTNTARAFDTVYHPSVIQPALLYWQRTGDPALTALFGERLKVWVDAAARAENGKPAGVLPSAIRWPEGGIARTDLPWWEPFPAGHNDALDNWPSAMRLMTSTLLLAHHMSRDESYLEPIHSMAALRVRHMESPEGEPGSEAWCARRMSGFLSDALAKYRLLTGDIRHDVLLRGDASGYVRYRLTGNRAPLDSALRRNAEAFRSNWEAYTSRRSQAQSCPVREDCHDPALRPFWEAGVELQRGQSVEAPALTVIESEPTELTLATAQVAGDPSAMETAIRNARSRNVDLIAFPARAIAETALDRLRAAARDHRITVVVGREHHIAGRRRNSAFVIAPEGEVLTRYDQLSATHPFERGGQPSARQHDLGQSA